MPARRPYRKRIYRRNGRSQARLYKDVAYLRSLVNSEMHHTEFSATASNVDSTGSITSLATVASDDTNNGRTGTRIMPRYFNFNGFLEAKSASVGWVRMILFMWKDDTTPTVSTILASSNVNGFLDEDIIGQKYDDRKIQVLRDRKYSVVTGLDKVTRALNMRVPMNGMKVRRKTHIKYDDDTGDVPIYNGIYMLLLSNIAAGSNPPQITYNARLSFYDN